MVGDSILTYEKEQPFIKNSISTFKEQLKSQPGNFQVEGCNKIFNINNCVLIGFSTDYVPETVLMLEYIEENLDSANIRESLLNILPSKCPEETELIIAFTENDKPVLAKYYLELNEIHDDGMPVHIGSVTDAQNFMELSEDICADLELNKTRADVELLLISVCTHQHLIVKNELTTIGAGGIVTGAMINSQGVYWQPSTTYVQYVIDIEASNKDAFSEIGIIHLKYFGDAMAYFSSFIEKRPLRRNSLHRCAPIKGDPKTVKKRYKYIRENSDTDSSDKFLDCPNSDFFVFFSNQPDFNSKIVIVRNIDRQAFAEISCLDDNGYYTVTPSEDLLTLVRKESEGRDVEYIFMN